MIEVIYSININNVHLDKLFSYCDRYLRKNKSYGYYPDLKTQLPTMYIVKHLQNNCNLISSVKKSSQQNHNHNCIERIGRYNKKNGLKSNSESVSYCYRKNYTKVISTFIEEKVTAEKLCELQNFLILKYPFKIQEVKFLRTKWIKRNDNSSKRMMDWSKSL